MPKNFGYSRDLWEMFRSNSHWAFAWRLKVLLENFGGVKKKTEEKFTGLNGILFVSLNLRVEWGSKTWPISMTLC